MPRLNVILASTRPGRVVPRSAHWFAAIARDHGGFDVDVVDLAELNLPFLDEPSRRQSGEPYLHEHTRRWSAIIAAADAFVFVMPEYNQGYTRRSRTPSTTSTPSGMTSRWRSSATA